MLIIEVVWHELICDKLAPELGPEKNKQAP